MIYKRDPQTYEIIGSAMEVHSELGSGFLENVYQKALTQEFKLRNIKYLREVRLPIFYKGVELDCYYQADLICFDNIIIELKALDKITNEHKAQIINYLKATGIKKGLIINFGSKSLEYERVVL